MKKQSKEGITFQLKMEASQPKNLPLFAYFVDFNGKSLDIQPINEDGCFKVSPESLPQHGVRLLIAPELPDKNQIPSLDDLRNIKAYEPVVNFDQKIKVQPLLPVPDELWPIWHWRLCRIRGRVEKDFCFWLPDLLCDPFPFLHPCPPRQVCFTLPVCPARVHICKLKPIIIWQIPSADLFRIRDDLLHLIPKKPFPPDPIGPVADSSVFQATMPIQGKSAVTAMSLPSDLPLSSTFQFKLQTKSEDLLRQALVDHFVELKPLIPYFDWCSFWYSCEEISVVDVDDQGHFDTWYFHECAEKLDLFFWIEYLYNTQWVTVYKPSFCSSAYWNYACGTEVVIKVTDSRVSGCRPITGRFLEVTRVGNSAFLPLIDAATGFVTGLGFGDDTLDPSGAAINSGAFQRPFGGTLAILGNFGFNLPDPALATHYRVSYKKPSDADWTTINTSLTRPYNDTVDIGGGLSQLVTSAFELRDPSYPGFYLIPNENADQQTQIPATPNLQDRRWAGDEFVIAVLDTETRALDTDTYDLRIELCRAPTPGAAPVPVVVARELFQMPDPTNFNQSKFCDDAHLIQPVAGGPDASAFRMRLRVDRGHCTSSIEDATVDSGLPDPNCGILNKGVNARIGFTASHPNDLATFSFGVVRGNGNDVGANTSGLVSAANAIHGYIRTGNTFVNPALPVSQLFAGATCKSAAFAETLSVLAMATDGSVRLNGYDASFKSAAFAIIDDTCDC